METTLLRFCLSLPKFNFILRSCPPFHIRHAASVFDGVMRESLSDLVGAPLSDWASLKASLPSSLGGLNMRSATLHAPSAYVSSLDQSRLLMTEILDRHPAPSRHLAEAVPDLAQAAIVTSDASDRGGNCGAGSGGSSVPTTNEGVGNLRSFAMNLEL